MADEIDRLLRDHYRALSAPEAVRQRLVALTADRAAQRQRQRRLAWSGLATAALLLIAFTWWTLSAPRYAGAHEIAASVAAHHRQRQASAVQAGRIQDIAQGLPRLDFALRLPQRDGLPEWRLDGGRYCSIAGNIAAQLRLTDVHGGQYTLYVSRAAGAVAAIDDFASSIDRVTVRIWRERDLTFACATDAP
jgi:hypothetical protein